MNDTIKKTSINGLYILERPTFPDERGFFHEVFRLKELEDLGIKFRPVQWGHSRSLPGVIRAIHSEAWQKIVYPINGQLFVAIADVRPESPTFGKVETFEFDNTSLNSPHQALFLPKGIGNSICVSGSSPVDYVYLVDEYWDNGKARGIAWDDPDLGIKWPVNNPVISERDRNNPKLRELYPKKFK